MSMRDWQIKVVKHAGMIGKPPFNQLTNLFRDLIRSERVRAGNVPRTVAAQSVPVLIIEVPFPAHRFALFHEHIVLFSHLAVEGLKD